MSSDPHSTAPHSIDQQGVDQPSVDQQSVDQQSADADHKPAYKTPGPSTPTAADVPADPELEARVEDTVTLLEAMVESRGLLAGLSEPMRRRLLIASGRLSRPSRAEQRVLNRAFRKRKLHAVRKADEALLTQTEIRKARAAAIFSNPPPREEPWHWPELQQPRTCYICKTSFERLHFFYDQMCRPCAELNYTKRFQTADCAGRVALLSGGRVKIGYQAGLMLLRAGARLIVTTRFPNDAAKRYASEGDFEAWSDRLEIHGLDLRHTPSVQMFAEQLLNELPRLDLIVHNACQTVRRPAGWYKHLLDGEHAILPADQQQLVAPVKRSLVHDAPALSQAVLLKEDALVGTQLFPQGQLDQDLQQVDLRDHNSWRMTLAQVPTVELLEVMLVNAVAPFVLNSKLKPLMLKAPTRDKHIVNVSAMEGQFYRTYKTDKHPHTNMAKAALNMMTRTSAKDYAEDGIHMNSVDTGWVTDEDPVQHAERKKEIHRFAPPLDIVDGAARILDPFFDGLNSGKHVWGCFLKDYDVTKW